MRDPARFLASRIRDGWREHIPTRARHYLVFLEGVTGFDEDGSVLGSGPAGSCSLRLMLGGAPLQWDDSRGVCVRLIVSTGGRSNA